MSSLRFCISACLFLFAFLHASHSQLRDRSELKKISKKYPLVVVVSYDLNCAPESNPNITQALANQLQKKNPPLTALEIGSQMAVNDSKCDGLVILKWKEEPVSFFVGNRKTKNILEWVDKHIATGDGYVLDIQDKDNPVVKMIQKKAVFATYDYRCKKKLSETLEEYKKVAKQVQKKQPALLMFNYPTRVLYKNHKDPVCSALPIYMYYGNTTIAKEKFNKKDLETSLLPWILNNLNSKPRLLVLPDKSPGINSSHKKNAASANSKAKESNSSHLKNGDIFAKPASAAKAHEGANAPSGVPMAEDKNAPFPLEIGKVSTLDDETFPRATANNSPPIVVAFLYASCENSRKFQRELKGLANELKSLKIPINLGQVIATKNIELLYRHARGSFPILKIYKNGRPFSNLTGLVEKTKVIAWIKEKLAAEIPDSGYFDLSNQLSLNKGVYILQSNTHERALMEKRLIVICYIPTFGFEHWMHWLRDIYGDYTAKNFPLAFAVRLDSFIGDNRRRKLYPFVVIYKEGEGVAHISGKDDKADIKNFIKDSIETYNLNTSDIYKPVDPPIVAPKPPVQPNSTVEPTTPVPPNSTSKPKPPVLPNSTVEPTPPDQPNSTVKPQPPVHPTTPDQPPNSTDGVIIIKDKDQYEKAKKKGTLLLASYPQNCCPTFFPIFRELSNDLKSLPGLSEIKLVELLDAFPIDSANPYIDFTLFQNGKQINHLKIAEKDSSKEEKKEKITKWVTESLQPNKTEVVTKKSR